MTSTDTLRPWVLDYTKNQFDRDFLEFNVNIHDLEMALQGFINSSFEAGPGAPHHGHGHPIIVRSCCTPVCQSNSVYVYCLLTVYQFANVPGLCSTPGIPPLKPQ